MFKKLILSLIAANLLVGVGATIYTRHQLEVSAWSAMCQILVDERADYLCGGILRPPVSYLEMDNMGQYRGEGTIEINRELTGDRLEGVLVHEFVHYVHQQTGEIEIPGDDREICWSEASAFYVQEVFDGNDYSGWWVNYSYCWPFYGVTLQLTFSN